MYWNYRGEKIFGNKQKKKNSSSSIIYITWKKIQKNNNNKKENELGVIIFLQEILRVDRIFQA